MSNTKATEYAAGLRALAAMTEANPDIAEHLGYAMRHSMLAPLGDKKTVRQTIRAALRAGAVVDKRVGDKYANFDIKFGPVCLKAYVDREEVCERIVTGTREVTEDVPDPVLLADIPIVTVTRTEEVVEWRCSSILADVAS